MAEKIIKQSIYDVVRPRFLGYAMSVITDRALPDILDGLKPVQRRILYAMKELGLSSEKQCKKSARIVGDTMGKYHPHGDTSIYGAMVTMVQDFNFRYPLIFGQGNWGSLDGDPAAAMRYTEASFTPIGYQMLADIDKNTCDMGRSFDDTLDEPKYLPSLLPNVLMNAVDGIAVGMATKMPSYNLTEVLNAVDYIIDQISLGVEPDENEVFKIIKGPDFPLGGVIVGKSGIYNAYKTGKGKIKIRSVYEIKEHKNYNEIIVTEIPYQVNKASLVSKIEDLRKEEIPEIKEVRDESDKKGVSIVIELKKDANVQLVINKLLKQTDLETAYSINNTLLVNNKPEVVTLMDILESYMSHCIEIIKRRSQFDLNKNLAKVHVMEGILWACSSKEHIDLIIDTIRESKTTDVAMEKIINLAKESEVVIDDIQAKAIIELRLRNFTQENEQKLLDEKSNLDSEIVRLTEIIQNPVVLLQQLKTELIALKEKFGDERRTQFISDDTIDEIDCIDEETLVITFSSSGIIKSVEEKEYRSTNRGSKGSKAATVKEDEAIISMLTINSKADLLFFTTLGKCHVLKAYKISKSSRTARGKSINNYLNLEPSEKIVKLISADLSDKENSFALITKSGLIKRLEFESLSTARSVTRVISFKEDDMLIAVQVVKNNDDIIITTAGGMSIRFKIEDIRSSGRLASGVRGIKLVSDDYVVDAVKVEENSTMLTVTSNGLAKRSCFDLYNTQSRGGKGTRTHKLNVKTGALVCATSVNEEDELFIATMQGQIGRINVDTIRSAGKSTSGVKIINLNAGDTIASVSRNYKEEEIDEVESEE